VFQVNSENLAGTSAFDGPSNSVVVIAAPDVPTNVTAALNGADVIVDWDAPVGGGTPATYNVQMTQDAGATWTLYTDVPWSQTSLTIGGLFDGTYQFRVNSQNIAGSSAYSTPSNAVVISGTPEL
jgi:hypothetical protein